MHNASLWSAACSTAMARYESSLMRSFLAISGIQVRRFFCRLFIFAVFAIFANTFALSSTSFQSAKLLISFFSNANVNPAPSSRTLTVASQIICSCAIAITSGVMLFYWKRLDAEAAATLWKLYGAFAACICFGSCVRVATWSVYIAAFRDIYIHTTYYPQTFASLQPRATPSRFSLAEVLSFWSSGLLNLGAWQVLYSVDFLCLCAANLMVLHRLRDFSGAVQKYKIGAIAQWLVPAVVMSACVAGVCGSIASAATRTRASSIAADALAVARMSDGANSSALRAVLSKTETLYKQSLAIVQEAETTDSVGNFSEMATLMLLVACFLIACILCLHRIRSVLLSAPASASAQRLHRQIAITAAVVFFTFLPRATFSSLKAVAGALQDIGKSNCLVPCSDTVIKASQIEQQRGALTCYTPFNQYSHMTLYLFYTPEFQLLTVLISSLSQLVALWAMTSERMLEAFRNKAETQLSLHRLDKA